MPSFEATIFDMDGVIIDSEPRHERAFREIFAAMGYGETHGIDFTQYYGRSDKTLWIDFIEKHRPAQPLDYLMSWKQQVFLEMIRQEEPIFETLPELVERLASTYRLGLASGSYHPVIEAVLSMKSLRRFFQAIVSAQDVSQGKPAPDIFLRAAQLLQVHPRKCCVIEDSVAGIEAAKAAGMQVIAITNTLPAARLTGADHIVSSYAEIDRLLLQEPFPQA